MALSIVQVRGVSIVSEIAVCYSYISSIKYSKFRYVVCNVSIVMYTVQYVLLSNAITIILVYCYTYTISYFILFCNNYKIIYSQILLEVPTFYCGWEALTPPTPS